MKLKEIFEKPMSGEWGTESSEIDECVPVIRTTNFKNTGELNFDNLVYRKIDVEKKKEKILKNGDIIIEKSGGSPAQPVGRVVYFHLTETETMFTNNFTAILRPRKNILPRYAFYLLRYLYSRKVVLKFQNKTTGIINFKLNDYLENVEIEIPSLLIQKKILDTLDLASELIKKRKEQIGEMDKLIQSVFYEMFGDPVTNFKVEFSEISLELLTKKIYGGGTPAKNNPQFYEGSIPWVTPKDMKIKYINDSRDHINIEAVRESSAKLIPENSLLMVIRSGILKRFIPLAINKTEVTVNQDMKAFVFTTEVNNQFMFYYIKALERQLLQQVRGVTADNFDFKLIKSLKIKVPLIKTQDRFATIVEEIEAQKRVMEQSLTEMENNFHALMQKAFNEELFPEE